MRHRPRATNFFEGGVVATLPIGYFAPPHEKPSRRSRTIAPITAWIALFIDRRNFLSPAFFRPMSSNPRCSFRASRQFVLGSLLLILLLAGAQAGWQIKTLGGRDYIPLRQVASFYKMRAVPAGELGIVLESDTRRMQFAQGSREARFDGIKHWLSFPVLVFGGQFFVSRMDLSKTIDPAMRPSHIPNMQPVRTVLLDPGHGGHDRGAVNQWGAEKNYNLDLCRRIRPHLTEGGLRVAISRSRDEFITLETRPALAGRLGEGAIFVSIHCNDAGQRSSAATGFEIYTLTPRGAPNSNDSFLTRRSFSAEYGHRLDHSSEALAGAIYHAMLGRVPMFDRGMKRARFAVLRRATVPAVLIECGFLSHPRDARQLQSMAWRDRLAESIALGILEYAQLTRTKKQPALLAQYRAVDAGVPAGEEFDYQPLAGIGAFVEEGFEGVRGWRGLLPSALGQEMPPFRLEFEPRGWVQLEAWAERGEDARSESDDEQSSLMEQSAWPMPVPPFPGLAGWRGLWPPSGLDQGFVLFGMTAGPLAEDSGEDSGEEPVAAIEIMGGAL